VFAVAIVAADGVWLLVRTQICAAQNRIRMYKKNFKQVRYPDGMTQDQSMRVVEKVSDICRP